MFIEVTKRNQIQSYDLKHERDMIYICIYIYSHSCVSIDMMLLDNSYNVVILHLEREQRKYMQHCPTDWMKLSWNKGTQCSSCSNRETVVLCRRRQILLFFPFHYCTLEWTHRERERESNNRLNDDDRAGIEEKKKKRDDWGQHLLNGVRIQNNSMKAKEKTTNGLQMIINIRQTEMLFNKKSSTYYV